MKILVPFLFPGVLLLALPLGAQTLVLESESTQGPLYCDTLHDLKSCALFHYDNPGAATAGSTIQLDGESYVVDWVGPGYYLESGVILEPLAVGTADLKGQQWLEVYPDRGAIHTSRAWKDVDGNRALSPSDTLDLDSEPGVRVDDVRLQLRVRPSPPAR